ncbi:ATP phosphoribosyltransferase [Halalkalibacillus halophilus]|uniref:ATP phosphoribosyltransferase n=1 Tax=Halalkalibacillus halophilus TaxID=392827 RepID=UPI0003FEC890|nr:ATP phosphoribosyltransferase [Halalkalibacillus halophilus]
MANKPIKLALAKGRLTDDFLQLIEQAGIHFSSYYEKSRKLTFLSDDGAFEMILVKAMDVGTYVENGAADIGVAGKDTLLENGIDVYELVDLGFGKCKFSIAGPESYDFYQQSPLTIATKYPKITNDYFKKQGKQIETIKLNGSVELAPIVGLSDVIVDIVETGNTLRENNLQILEDMIEISARLVVNKASYKTKESRITPFINHVKEQLSKQGSVSS